MKFLTNAKSLAVVTCIFLFLFSSCSDEKEKSREVNLDCLYSQLSEMQELVNTAVVGSEDGMYPQASVDSLASAIDRLQIGISKAKAGIFVLQYEPDAYCNAAGEAILTFLRSQQTNLNPGDPGELVVYGKGGKGRIEFGESTEFSSSKTFTVESWIKYEKNFFEYAIADFITTFSHNGAGIKQGWMINFSGSNLRTTIGVGPQQERVLEWGAAYPETYDTWIHIATVYDENASDNQLKMYINGELFFSKTNDVTNSGVVQLYQPCTNNLKMWAFQEADDQNRCMSGYMKKFRLWKTAKSQSQIKELMTSDVSILNTDLTCAWDFTKVPDDNEAIPDITGKFSAKLVGSYKWMPVEE